MWHQIVELVIEPQEMAASTYGRVLSSLTAIAGLAIGSSYRPTFSAEAARALLSDIVNVFVLLLLP